MNLLNEKIKTLTTESVEGKDKNINNKRRHKKVSNKVLIKSPAR